MASDDAVESGDVTVLDAAGDESRMRIVQQFRGGAPGLKE
jgi:hypothetical protein